MRTRLDKEPDHRYQTANGALYDLERLGETESASNGSNVALF